jgi:hypothetical protein
MSHEEARLKLNQWIDGAIKEYAGWARRRSGRQGAYEVFVDIDKVAPSMEGVEVCRSIISRVIEMMEKN